MCAFSFTCFYLLLQKKKKKSLTEASCFQWKEILEKTLADLDQEIADLSEAKELTEEALEAKNIPTDTVVENLTMREGRHSIDVVQDEVENQLHKVCIHVCLCVCLCVCVCVVCIHVCVCARLYTQLFQNREMDLKYVPIPYLKNMN